MSSQERPIDLVAFFGLSTDEAVDLGLDDATPPTPAAASIGGSTVERLGPEIAPLDGTLLGDTEQLALHAGNLPIDNDDTVDPLLSLDGILDDARPDGQAQGRPGIDGDADSPPWEEHAGWPVPASPLPRGTGNSSAWEGLAGDMPPLADLPATPAPVDESDWPGTPAPAEPFDLAAMGRGPYGLTEEQLAELGPDILRDLDLAMAEQLATLRAPAQPPSPAERPPPAIAPREPYPSPHEGLATMPLVPPPDELRPPVSLPLIPETPPTPDLVVALDPGWKPQFGDAPDRASGDGSTQGPSASASRAPFPAADPLSASVPQVATTRLRPRRAEGDEQAPPRASEDARTQPTTSALQAWLKEMTPISGARWRSPAAPAPMPEPAAPDASGPAVPSAPLAPPAPASPSAAAVLPMPAVAAPRTAVAAPPRSKMAQELLEVFMEEAIEMLDSLHTSLELLERTPSMAAVIEANRTVHTIKGGARMCGLPALTALSHACEDAIGPAATAKDTLPSRLIALLFLAEQEMRAALTDPAEGPGSAASLAVLAAQLRALMGDTGAAPAPQAMDADPDDIGEAGEEEQGVFAAVAAVLEDSPDTGRLGGAPPPLLRRPAIAASQGSRLAVDLQKVENMVAKVTEIVANRAASHGLMETLGATVTESMRTVHRLQNLASQLHYQIASQGLDMTEEYDPNGLALETYGPLKQMMLQMQEAVADQQALIQATMDIVTNKRALAAVETRLDSDLQTALLNIRLLPLSQLRVRLDQVVRSSAASAHREVRWAMEGQNVALDKHVCDRLFEPLMHLLRNAIDHGIEPPDEREAMGKPRVGRVVVHASVEGNQALVTVSDDGAGIDADRIAAKAVERGLISAEQCGALSAREKLDLVFRPGFSTASAITELSGRGMGMEIVREACTRMGGSATIAPRPSGGTVVTLQVPLSLSVLHALIVKDNGRLLGIPASQVASVHLVRSGTVSENERGRVVRMGREEVQLYRLPPGPAARSGVVDPSGEFSVLIVPYKNGRVAVAVDELVNEEDLIVKSLPHLLQGVDRLLGAVVLSNGVPAPVLNLPPLLDLVLAEGAAPPPVAPRASVEQLVLVVDDSLTMRIALTQTLGHAGFRVLTARDGQEALELIRTNGLPNLVTLDIEMPRMDGLETLYAIRNTEGGAAIPVFMLTSRSGHKHKRTAMKLGATRYFTKPYHDREFLRAVQEATGIALRSAG